MFTNKKGSLFVDAAVCIPVFLLSIVSLLGLFVQAGKEEARYEQLTAVAQAALAVEQSDGDVNIVFPAGKAVIHLCYRPWIGAEADALGDQTIVYIFPKYGEKYHIPGCSLIKQYPANYEAVSISEAEERGFGACKLCVGGLHTFEPGHGGRGLQ